MPTPYGDATFHTQNIHAVRRRAARGDRRRARHHRPLGRLALPARADQERGALGPGADRRAADEPALQRGCGLRPRQPALPRHLLRGRAQALGRAGAGGGRASGRGGADAALLGALARAGALHQRTRRERGRPRGAEVPRLQRPARGVRPSRRRRAGAGRGARHPAGLRHRPGRGDDDLALHRRRLGRLGLREPLHACERLAAEERGGGEPARLRRARRGDPSRQ